MNAKPGLVEIDGSYGEGGGQLLRTAVALSAITGKATHIKNIRGGRPNPGMQAQHLKGVEAVAVLCDAKVQGAKIGSTDLTFEPGEIRPRVIKVDIGTAGAVTLVLQALVLAAGRSEASTTVELIGGTHVAWSPPVDHFRDVLSCHLRKIGVDVSFKVHKYGFYPRGGGRVEVQVKGRKEWRALSLEEAGPVETIEVDSVASLELSNSMVAERQADGFRSVIGGSVSEKEKYVSSLSTGSAVFGRAVCGSTVLGGDSLGKKGVRAEEVGKDAAKKLKAEIEGGGTVDVHAADMILPYLALASGPSTFTVREMSDHLTSVQWLIRHFVEVEFGAEKKGDVHSISVRPAGK